MAEGENVLFACTRCYNRYPFEYLSPDQHLCRNCREIYEPSADYTQIAKCSYCRSEFQQTRKDGLICEKCEQNLIKFGQPSICECCSLLAAFIGKKCQRCHNSEKKYGAPVYCQQCKLKCAFERDDDKKVEGVTLCWLCTLAYKRALAKAKPSEHKYYVKSKPERVDVTKQYQVSRSPGTPEPKQPRLSAGREIFSSVFSMDSACGTCSQYLVTVTQLREEIANLQRQLTQKDRESKAKDMQMTEMKAEYLKNENEIRNRMKQNEHEFEIQLKALQSKLKQMQKEIAALSKLKNKHSNPAAVKKSGLDDRSSALSADSPEKS